MPTTLRTLPLTRGAGMTPATRAVRAIGWPALDAGRRDAAPLGELAVQTRVRVRRQHDDVGRLVVQPVAVDVVNVLERQQRSADLLLGDESVLVHPSSLG